MGFRIEINADFESENRILEIEKRLSDLEKEKSVLLSKLSKLRLSAIPEKESPLLGLPATSSAPVTASEKKISASLAALRKSVQAG